MDTSIQVFVIFMGIAAFSFCMYPKAKRELERSDNDKLISCLESCTFILLHSTAPITRAMVHDIYYGLAYSAKNGRLDISERVLKRMHECAAKEFEAKQKEIREKGPGEGAF